MKITSTLVAAAIAGMTMGVAACASNPPANDASSSASQGMTAKHDCKGKNTCRGQGGCSASKNGCRGKNDCKGQGGCKSGDAGCKGKNTCKGKGGCAVPSKH